MLKKSLSVLLALILLIGVITVVPFTASATEASGAKKALTVKDEYIEGEAIVVFEDEMAVDAIEDDVTVEDTMTVGDAENENNIAVVSDDALTTEEIIDELKDNEEVKHVFPNRIRRATGLTDDAYSDYQWTLQNTGHDTGIEDVDINPENLWNKAEQTGGECVVAVVDTGIDMSHEDLKNVLWSNPYSSLPGRVGNCGYDCTGENADGQPIDIDGHGSHVAGIIAAQANNNLGISGVNQSNVKIMALRACNKNDSFTTAYEIKAFDFITKAKNLGVNIRAVNLSYGGFGDAEELQWYNETFDAFGELGIVTCIAAGNEDNDVDEVYYDNDDNELYINPAATTSEYALTVAAMDERRNCATFSNYGIENVDIAAPGVNILSTVSYNNFEPSLYNATQRSQLCQYYQNFESGSSIPSGQLFSTINRYSNNGSWNLYDDEDYFGPSGHSMSIQVPAPSSAGGICRFGVPYTISNTTDKYYISFKIKVYGYCDFAVYDTAASDSGFTGCVCYYNPCFEWDECNFEIDPLTMDDYTKSTSRELYFYVETYDSDTVWVQLDDFAVSKQNPDESKFGKYAFYPGTSMASPVVAGAAALVANAYPSASAAEVITAIKDASVKDEDMAAWVQDGRCIDLRNLTIGEPDPPENLVLLGDFDDNEDVNALDATMMQRYNAGMKLPSYVEINEAAGDIDDDGELSMLDVTLLMRFLAGINVKYPVNEWVLREIT